MRNYFLSTIKESLDLNKYTYGIEVEFYANTEYFKNVTNRSKGILGIDDAGKPVAEYRSRVFKSIDPINTVKACHRISFNILNFIKSNYATIFSPHYSSYSFGIHFSIGGKFLLDKKFSLRLEKANEVQKRLVYLVEDQEKYLQREEHWNGNFSSHNAYKAKDSEGYIDNNLKHNIYKASIVEFRFLPSCRLETVVPYIEYILTDNKKMPDNKILYYYDRTLSV